MKCLEQGSFFFFLLSLFLNISLSCSKCSLRAVLAHGLLVWWRRLPRRRVGIEFRGGGDHVEYFSLASSSLGAFVPAESFTEME